jgi:hypothetical protein
MFTVLDMLLCTDCDPCGMNCHRRCASTWQIANVGHVRAPGRATHQQSCPQSASRHHRWRSRPVYPRRAPVAVHRLCRGRVTPLAGATPVQELLTTVAALGHDVHHHGVAPAAAPNAYVVVVHAHALEVAYARVLEQPVPLQKPCALAESCPRRQLRRTLRR